MFRLEVAPEHGDQYLVRRLPSNTQNNGQVYRFPSQQSLTYMLRMFRHPKCCCIMLSQRVFARKGDLSDGPTWSGGMQMIHFVDDANDGLMS